MPFNPRRKISRVSGPEFCIWVCLGPRVSKTHRSAKLPPLSCHSRLRRAHDHTLNRHILNRCNHNRRRRLTLEFLPARATPSCRERGQRQVQGLLEIEDTHYP